MKDSLRLPPALLVDLDDTILSFSMCARDFWREALERHWPASAPCTVDRARAAIEQASKDYWADSARAARGRLDLFGSRRDVARRALEPEGLDPAVTHAVADHYAVEKERAMAPLPGALDALAVVRSWGHRVVLVTNGAGADQRRKLARFGIAGLFDAVVIEGEWGVGKPHASIFTEALRQIDARPEDAMMIGDNFGADVEGAAAVGLATAWIDHARAGPPPNARAKPDWIVAQLCDLIELGHSGTRGA
jgi:putative hydrolase of the HAD superfamily